MIIALSKTALFVLFFGISSLYAYFFANRNTFFYSLLRVLFCIQFIETIIKVGQSTNIDSFFLGLIAFPGLIGLRSVFLESTTHPLKRDIKSVFFFLGLCFILGMNIYITHGDYTPSNKLIITNKSLNN